MQEIKMKRKLENGEEFKNRAELCDALGWKYAGGNSGKKILKILNALCLWKNAGNKIIIIDVFDEPKPIEDKRFNCKYADEAYIILASNNGYYSKISRGLLAKTTGLIPKDLNCYDYEYDKLHVNYMFYRELGRCYKDILETIISNLQHYKLLEATEEFLTAQKLDEEEPHKATEEDISFYNTKAEKYEEFFADEEWGEPSTFDYESINSKNIRAYKYILKENNYKYFYYGRDIKINTSELQSYIDKYKQEHNLDYNIDVLDCCIKEINKKFVERVKKRIDTLLKNYTGKTEDKSFYEYNFKKMKEQYDMLLSKIVVKNKPKTKNQ